MKTICKSCSKESSFYIKSRELCRSCYTKERIEIYSKSPGIECSECKTITPYNLLDNKKKKLCHNCYNRLKRQEIIQEAKNNPEKRKNLKEKYRRNYLKSKANGHYKSLSRRITTTFYRMKKTGLELTLDIDWFMQNIVDKNCYYCGVEEQAAHKISGTKLQIDRLNPNQGYTKENCVPACKACNTAKLNIWTPEETKQLGKLISEFYKKRLG